MMLFKMNKGDIPYINYLYVLEVWPKINWAPAVTCTWVSTDKTKVADVQM